jgi:catechol 2,3-dioxygenase-like lactoylglutathione lyase family enzyme
MKRLHVHVSVRDLERARRIYSDLFDSQPCCGGATFANWRVDNPPANFAASIERRPESVLHLGLEERAGRFGSDRPHLARHASVRRGGALGSIRAKTTGSKGAHVMKRMHIHVAVDDIRQSVGFYSALFAAEPSVVKADYAKWMLDDARVNFASGLAGGRPVATISAFRPRVAMSCRRSMPGCGKRTAR